MTKIAIMQPTYLPWCGYFKLMAEVDKFVILDTVQFEKRSWQQRNKIKTFSSSLWLTVPVKSKGKRDQKIIDVKIDYETNFYIKHIKSIETFYRKAKYYKNYSGLIFDIINSKKNKLVDLNLDLIFLIKDMLDIKTKILRASELKSFGNKSEYLSKICFEVGASEYISPPGSQIYLSDEFSDGKNIIPISYLNFLHPEYPQLYGNFLPYMSIIDMILNNGPKSREIMLKV